MARSLQRVPVYASGLDLEFGALGKVWDSGLRILGYGLKVWDLG